ncbi:MAG: SDR family NAD(P)-dependent oxidoreductase [Pseudomonadota bacterium]|nr:SDR family NAD(P)-dependent oxidoreductase [Pseudomonadota bacterium]
MTSPLDGAVAIVTGSAMNIGREICRQLAAMGARVVTHAASNRAGAEETAALIRAHGGADQGGDVDWRPDRPGRRAGIGGRRARRFRRPAHPGQ